jgi:3-oxoacyl-[acyl-carrier protein] reductase
VTGGSSDIGLFLARRLMDEGLFPVLTFRNEKGKEKILATLDDAENRFDTAFFDLKDPFSVNGLFKENNEAPDYLVDLAHTDYESLVASGDCARMDAYFKQNIITRASLVRKASRLMIQKRFGRLVFISSAAVVRPGHGQGFYAGSKLACEALYKNCGLELFSRGITALTIRPGYVDAGRGKTFLDTPEQKKNKRKSRIPAVNVKALCESIVFFLSDSALAFNAVAVTMDCGLSAGK